MTIYMKIVRDIPLSTHTTLKVGGPSAFFVSVASADELKEALEWAGEHRLPFFILGGGSNVLFPDSGFSGLVIQMDIKGIVYEEKGDSVRSIVKAGENWDEFVEDTVKRNLWGLENLSGIPGTVGASPVQNIGAYGVEVAEQIQYVEVFDVGLRKLKRLTKEECVFGYRNSIFKQAKGAQYIVTEVCFCLSKQGSAILKYKDLVTYFKNKSTSNISEVRNAVLAIRAEKFPDMVSCGTAGSFFKNPIVSKEKGEELKALYPDIPLYMVSNTKVKLSLAWILDKLLCLNNYSNGKVSLFKKQPLVFVTEKNARAFEIIKLMQTVQKLVFEKVGIKIIPEVTIVESKT